MWHARQVTMISHVVAYLLSGTLHVDGFAALHALNGLVIRYQLPKRPHRVPRGRYQDDLWLFPSLLRLNVFFPTPMFPARLPRKNARYEHTLF